MELTNEILFNPVGFFNYNLDPTSPLWLGDQRNVSAQMYTLLFRGGLAYTRAVFREGPFHRQ